MTASRPRSSIAGRRAPGDRRGRRRARVGRGGRAGRARRGAANPGRDLAQRQGFDPRQASAVGRRGRHLFARERQPRGQPRRSGLLHRHRDRRHDHAFLGGAEDRHAGDPDRHRPGGDRPQLSAARRRQRRRQGHARAHAGAGGSRERRQAQGLDRGGAKHLQGVVREVQSHAQFGRCADQARAHVRGIHQARARQRHRGGRHRPRRHVDGRHVRSAHAHAELYPQRRPSRLGVPGGARRQVRRARAAGGDVHRRRRLLVSHRRDRDRGALGHQRGDGGQQQFERQPVQARLRPRLWRQADRAGARDVALQQGQFRPHRRGHGRARHPGREAVRARARRCSRRSRPTGRW